MKKHLLLAARLGQDICRALSEYQQGFMWTDSTSVLQWLNSTTKHPIFIVNRVCEILEKTSVDGWNHVASSDKQADASFHCMSAEVFQVSSWVRPRILKNQVISEPGTEVFNNIKLGTAAKENDKTNTSLTTSITKSTKKPPRN